MNLITNNNLIIRKKDSTLIIIFGVLVCVLMAFLKENIFPEKYFYDSHGLQKLIERPNRYYSAESFTNTATFYRILHIDRIIVAPILALLTYFFVIFKLFKNYSVNYISFFSYALIVIYSAIAMVYLATFSKDLVLFIIVVVPFVFLEKKSLIIWTLFVIFYAYVFRTYWFISIALFWFIKLFIIQSPKRFLLLVPVIYLIMNVVYHYVFGTSIALIREGANTDRDIESGQTIIKTYIEGSNVFLESLNSIVTLIFLILPIPLFLLLKPFYVILTILITVFFFNFIKLYVKQYKNKDYTNIFSFVISFMLVQSLFEPDYGSFVRHLSPLYPLIFVCVAKNTKFVETED
ncbi:hypothetical protein [Chryseobacterium wangxinyae]|uniref:hypothetical protein n=1 Tax=Chryseobacterium sp. CY353 TaxID=2997334 RepID=UPI00226E8C4C|nr:hypothetical protein [Chryseobacterium sp. CY353]MCY0970069.1 hypothetical protein [Chryseobacterium sp. CY353]